MRLSQNHVQQKCAMIKQNPLYPKIVPLSVVFLSLFLSAFVKSDSRSQYIIPLSANSVFSSDFDLDGHKDIVVGHYTAWQDTNPTLTIMKNLGSGTFEVSDTSNTFCGYQENVFMVDVNADSYPDIVTFYSDFSSGNAVRYIRVFYNNSGIFSAYTDFTLNSDDIFNLINYGDFSGDGDTDLIVGSNSGHFWGVLYNDGTGHFSPPEYFNLTYPPQGISTGDLNGDGRDDIAICSQTIEVYFSYPSGFQKLILDSVDFRDRIKIVDFDLDGNKDLFTIEDIYGIITYYNVFKNNGNNAFEKLPDSSFQPGGGEIIAKDFNNDSLPDVAFLLDNKTGYFIYYNQGNFQLADSQFVAVPDYGYGELRRNCTSDDLDNNGFNDIITTRFAYLPLPSNLDILFNDGQGHFVPDPIVSSGDRKDPGFVSFNNFPNPFHSETTFAFEIKETAEVELSVYTLQGEFVSCVIGEILKGGHYAVKWHRPDQDTQPYRPGVFVACLKVNGKTSRTIKVIKN